MARERTERAAETPRAQLDDSLSVAELRQLIMLMSGSDLEEITIEQEASGLRLTLRKPAPSEAAVVGSTLTELDALDGAEPPYAEPASAAALAEVRAPLVGIFRAALTPGGRPAVAPGDVVREGQVVGAIEALNVLNEVEAAAPGRVRDILVGDGQAVEYGQTLLVVEPVGA